MLLLLKCKGRISHNKGRKQDLVDCKSARQQPHYTVGNVPDLPMLHIYDRAYIMHVDFTVIEFKIRLQQVSNIANKY